MKARAPDPDDHEAVLDLLRGYLDYLRRDVAETVNGLNNRLNAILAAAREIPDDRLDADARRELERIREETARATTVTGGLLKRVEAAAFTDHPHFTGEGPAAFPPRSHVVVVEDDAANRSVATRLLQRAGHLVTACENGLEAMEILDLGQVDCIVCDIRMPTLSGRGLYEQVEERLPHLATRFVFVTGDFAEPKTRHFLDNTHQPVLAKPYESAELLAAVTMVLRQAWVDEGGTRR